MSSGISTGLLHINSQLSSFLAFSAPSGSPTIRFRLLHWAPHCWALKTPRCPRPLLFCCYLWRCGLLSELFPVLDQCVEAALGLPGCNQVLEQYFLQRVRLIRPLVCAVTSIKAGYKSLPYLTSGKKNKSLCDWRKHYIVFVIICAASSSKSSRECSSMRILSGRSSGCWWDCHEACFLCRRQGVQETSKMS
jgi:hypothetical protein